MNLKNVKKIKKIWKLIFLPFIICAKRLVVKFFQKNNSILILIFISVISFPLTFLFYKLLIRISPAKFFYILIYYTVFLILGYIFYIKKYRDWINRHHTFLTILGILIPIILFWWQQTINDSNLFFNYEVSLKEENNRNISHLQSVASDLKNDPKTIFWRDFSTNKYKQYWDYIHLNYSQECKNLYATVTIDLDILNNMNQMRRELILIPNNIYKDVLDTASNTQPIFNEIVSSCQKI